MTRSGHTKRQPGDREPAPCTAVSRETRRMAKREPLPVVKAKWRADLKRLQGIGRFDLVDANWIDREKRRNGREV